MPLDSPLPNSLAMPAPIRIEFLKWGKLVAGPDQCVPADQGYAITRRSSGLPPSKFLLSSRSVLGAPLNPHRLYPAAAEDGVFALRLSSAFDAASAPGIVMIRARFLSEAGTKVHGRIFELTEFWNVGRDDWLDAPGLVLSHACMHLRARADSIEETAAQRLADEPILLPRSPRKRPGDALAQFDNAAQETVAVLHDLLLGAMPSSQSASTECAVFGLESFPNEAAFLRALAEAADILVGLGSESGAAGGVTAILEGLTVITGYSGPNPGLGSSCLTYKPILLQRAHIDRMETRRALTALIGRPELAPSLGAESAPVRLDGGRERESRSDAISLERFARSFDAACRQPDHNAVRVLIDEARPLVMGETSFIEARNRRAMNRLAQPAWRFLVGLAASRLPFETDTTGASLIDLWTTLAVLAQDPDWERRAPDLDNVVARLRDGARSQAILIPEELALLDGSLPSGTGRPGERACRRIAMIRHRLLCSLDPSGEGLDEGLIETSRTLSRWLADRVVQDCDAVGLSFNNSTGAPDAVTRDRIVRRLLVRFERTNWRHLDRDSNAAFITAFMPAVVLSCLDPAPREQVATGRRFEYSEAAAWHDGEAVIRLAKLTRQMVAFIQPALDPRPQLWKT